MDFWRHQEEAKGNTVRLVLLYVFGLLLLSLILAAPIVYFWNLRYPGGLNLYVRYAVVISGIGSFIGACSFFSPVSLKTGGRSVAESLGGKRIMSRTSDPRERRLLNVVEEMALASGIPVPPVYMLEAADINAFAAGFSLRDAVIGVTRGALARLNREELQGVIAHEFSHIRNGDMRLNLRFVQLVFGLTCLSCFGQTFFRAMRRVKIPRKGGGLLVVLAVLAVACLIFSCLGRLLSRILQAAVNREREFLADASAVQFTRSLALASALKKIGSAEPNPPRASLSASPPRAPASARNQKMDVGGAYPRRVDPSPFDSIYNHLFFCGNGSRLLSTHPPLTERIRRLQPYWLGAFPKSNPPETDEEIQSELQLAKPGRLSRHQPEMVFATLAAPALPPEPGPAAEEDETERRLREACREPLDAALLVFALLLDRKRDVSERQLTVIGNSAYRKTIQAYALDADKAGDKCYVSLLTLAAPALKMFSQPQGLAFRQALRHFIDADGEFSFREWILWRIVDSQIGLPADHGGEAPPATEAAGHVLAFLARLEPDEEKARAAFAAGCRVMGLEEAPMPEKASRERLDACLGVLSERAPESLRQSFLRAARETAMFDWRLTGEEDMFLRMLAVCLGKPDPAAGREE